MSYVPSVLPSPVKELALISILEGWEECSNLSPLQTLSLGWTTVVLASLCPGWPCALVWITLWPALLASLSAWVALFMVGATPGTPWVYLYVCH